MEKIDDGRDGSCVSPVDSGPGDGKLAEFTVASVLYNLNYYDKGLSVHDAPPTQESQDCPQIQ